MIYHKRVCFAAADLTGIAILMTYDALVVGAGHNGLMSAWLAGARCHPGGATPPDAH